MPQRVRLGFIGAGWWATAIQMPYFAAQPDVELVSVCRLGPTELERVRAHFGFQHATEDYRETLRQNLDGVVVASPHPLHYNHARAALQAGCHVLVEKPMTTSATDARALVTLAQEAGKQIVVPHGWSFTPLVREAQRLVRSGGVGAIRHVSCQMASSTGDLFSGLGLAETADAMFQPPPSTWADPAQAGGYGWGQLVHALGVLFSIADLQPQQVFALMGHSPSGADLYDALSVRFTNGATAAISGAGTIPKPLGTQNDRSKGYQIDIRIFGTDGMLLLDVERERLVLRRDDGADVNLPVQPGDGDYPAELPFPVFLAICRGEAVENPSTGAMAAHAVAVLDAAYRSAQSGKLEDVE